jgi:hypothetical protein
VSAGYPQVYIHPVNGVRGARWDPTAQPGPSVASSPLSAGGPTCVMVEWLTRWLTLVLESGAACRNRTDDLFITREDPLGVDSGSQA